MSQLEPVLNIHQNKQKTQCTNLIQKAIPLHMETWIQVSFLLQKGYCFLQLRGSLPKCQKRHVPQGMWLSAALSSSYWKHKAHWQFWSRCSKESERHCCTYSKVLSCEPSSDLGTHSSVLREPSWFPIVWMPTNTRLLSYLEWGGKSSHHVQNTLLSTFESLATPKCFCKARDAVSRL